MGSCRLVSMEYTEFQLWSASILVNSFISAGMPYDVCVFGFGL